MAANQNFEPTSTRPYLIRAMHEWCSDNGYTPYITVSVDASVQVPLEYVKDDEIVLNIGFDATTALRMSNDYVEFKARFSGAVREIMIPVDQITAIFARENGQGMAFPKPDGQKNTPPLRSLRTVSSTDIPAESAGADDSDPESSARPPKIKKKPSLTRIK